MSAAPREDGPLAGLGRLEFRAGRPIRAEDLDARSIDLRWRLHLHQALQHGPGIVAGLGLAAEGEDRLRVAAGFAIAGDGRPLWLPSETLEPAPAGAADIWLVAAESAALPRRRGRIEVRPCAYGRMREGVSIEPSPAAAPPPGPSQAAEVLLGSVTRIPGKPLDIRSVGAHRARALGEAVGAHEGKSLLVTGISSEAVGPRFSVPAEGKAAGLEVRVTGDADWRGQVQAERAGVAGLQFDVAGPPAVAPRPWSLARAAVPQEGGPPREVLRLELDAGEGDAAARGFEIAERSRADKKVRSPFALAAGDLRIARTDEKEWNLLIGGRRIRAPAPVDPADERFVRAMTEAQLKGIAAGFAHTDVHGFVRDEEGKGVGDATVEIIGVAPGRSVDAEGAFVVRRVGWPGQIVFVRATAPGKSPRVVVGTVQSELVITLEDANGPS